MFEHPNLMTRGNFLKIFKLLQKKNFKNHEIKQVNISTNKSHIIRGMHYQNPKPEFRLLKS